MTTHEEMTMQEENKEIVRRASFEAYDEGDLGIIDEVVSEDFVLHDASIPEDLRGREGLKEHVESYRAAFPDPTTTIESMIAEGDTVAVCFTFRGTHEGVLPEFPDLEPTGEEVEVRGMEFDRIEDGKLAETWLVYDSLGMLQQLGAVPDEAVPAER